MLPVTIDRSFVESSRGVMCRLFSTRWKYRNDMVFVLNVLCYFIVGGYGEVLNDRRFMNKQAKLLYQCSDWHSRWIYQGIYFMSTLGKTLTFQVQSH